MKLKMTRKQAMEHYLSVIKECLEEGISPRCHLEDITRADIYGYVVPFCLELMKLMKEYQIPIKIRACDTMGYGVNYPGAVIPRSVQGIIYALHTHCLLYTSDQLILTSPVSIGGIVVGKYLAMATVFTIPVAVMALFPLILSRYGTVPMGESYTALLAYYLFGLTCLAIEMCIRDRGCSLRDPGLQQTES